MVAGLGIAVAASLAACSSSGSTTPAAGSSSSANSNSQATINTSPGQPWNRVWADSFNGPAGSKVSSAWMYNQGHGAIFGTGEIETITDATANTHLSGNGQLVITPIRDASGAWTSGRIQTKSSGFAAPAGGEMMITSTLKQPAPANSTGYWTGFWVIGKGQWPEHGEIDILEDVNHGDMVSGSMHCGNLNTQNPDGTKGPCHETNGLGSGQRTCANCQNSYHTYSVIVDRRTSDEQVRWYKDGREYFSINENRVGQAAWSEGIDGGFSIIFDVAIGGGYPNIECKCQTPSASTTSGAPLDVKDVSVYTLQPASS
jgi:hypothetical protein